MAIFKPCTSFSEPPRWETNPAEVICGSTGDRWIFCACFGCVLYHVRWCVLHYSRNFVPKSKKKVLTEFFFFFLGCSVPSSCQTLLGPHLVSVCVPYCQYDGTESQLDSTSACVFAVWADCRVGLRRHLDAHGCCEESAPERCGRRFYRSKRGSTSKGGLETGRVERTF